MLGILRWGLSTRRKIYPRSIHQYCQILYFFRQTSRNRSIKLIFGILVTIFDQFFFRFWTRGRQKAARPGSRIFSDNLYFYILITIFYKIGLIPGWARNFVKIQPADSQPEPGWPANFQHEPEIGLSPKFCKNPTRRFSTRARFARLFPTRARSPGPVGPPVSHTSRKPGPENRAEAEIL